MFQSKPSAGCPPALQATYLRLVAERNQQEKSQFREVITHYMEALRSVKAMQD